MGLLFGKRSDRNGMLFLIFQREIYRRLEIESIRGEPFFTLAWIGSVSAMCVFAIGLSRRFTWRGGVFLLLSGVVIALLVFVSRKFGVIAQPCRSAGHAVELRIRLEPFECRKLQEVGIDPADIGAVERFIRASVAVALLGEPDGKGVDGHGS